MVPEAECGAFTVFEDHTEETTDSVVGTLKDSWAVFGILG